MENRNNTVVNSPVSRTSTAAPAAPASTLKPSTPNNPLSEVALPDYAGKRLGDQWRNTRPKDQLANGSILFIKDDYAEEFNKQHGAA